MKLIEALVADRQAELLRQGRQARHGRDHRSSEAGWPRVRAHRRRHLSRGVGRLLVAVGLRLAGPEALRGRVVLADGGR